MKLNGIPTIKQYKEQARRLRMFLRAGGIEIKHTHALEAVAKMHGAKDYRSVIARCSLRSRVFPPGTERVASCKYSISADPV